MIKLEPRLNYRYPLFDFIQSLIGFFKNKIDDNELRRLFHNNSIFYVNHARIGIWVVLKALNLPPGSRIGVQAYNCHTVFQAIYQAGHRPVFIDVTDSFQIDLEDLKEKVTQLDALIITHLFGIPAPMAAVKEITKDIAIIEDCAHSFLSRYHGVLTGTMGDFGVFSIGKGKFPSIGDGGYIVVNKKEYITAIAEYVDQMPKNSIFTEIKAVFSSVILNFLHNPFFYKFFTLPILKKLDEQIDISGKFKFENKKILSVNKALFLKKMGTYTVQKQIQKKNAQEFFKIHFDKTEKIRSLNNQEYELNYFMIPLLIENNRDDFIKRYAKQGSEIGTHFSCSISWALEYGYAIGDCPNAEKIASQIVVLPTYHKIKILDR